MPDDRLPGQALATRRAVTDIVRTVTLGSYGVVDLGGSALARWLGTITARPPGIRVSLAGGEIAIELRLRVAHGVPIAEVARQVDSAVRFAVRRALRREIRRLTIRVASLEVRPASQPPRRPAPAPPGSSDSAGGGTGPA